ncbi:EamA family transporter [Corynebacterium sp. 335C]
MDRTPSPGDAAAAAASGPGPSVAAESPADPAAVAADRRAGFPASAVLLVLGSCASLQFGAALATHLMEWTGAAGASVLRVAVAGTILAVVARPKVLSWNRRQWGAVWLMGLGLAGMNGFFYAGIQRIPLGAAVTLEFLGPLLLAAFLSRRALDFLWVAMALAGVGLLGLGSFTGGTSLDPVGVACVLVAGAFWALYIPAGAKVGALLPGTGGLAAAFLVAAVLLAPFGAVPAATADWSPGVVLLALGTALLSSLIPYMLEFAALRRLPQSVFGILLSLEPAFGALAGFLVLGQVLGLTEAAAIILVICASAGVTATGRRRRAAAKEEAAEES